MTADAPDTNTLLGPRSIAEVPAADEPIDDYYERYRAVEPTLLHSQLMAGDADQVQDKVASKWSTVVSCVGTVASDLRKVLTEAKAVWEGDKYDEFERELLPVMQRAESLAAKAQKMQSGLTMMSAMLALAQHEAEAPPPRPDAIYDVTDVIGSNAGYTPSQGEQSRIAARLVKIVAELALKYFLVEQKVWNAPLPAPEPIAAPEEPAGQMASAADQTPASRLDGSPPPPPPERSTHLVGVGAGAGGGSPMIGGMPTVPMAAAMGGAGVGGDSSASRSRGWTSAETQWSSDGRPVWTDEPGGGDPHPVVGDPAVV